MSKLKKRKFKAVVEKESGKWYTGYVEHYLTSLSDNQYYNERYPLCIESDNHVVTNLSLKYSTYERGRSAANIVMVEADGYTYNLSMSSFDKLMLGANDPDNKNISLNDEGWFIGEFMQIKQGSTYFIAVVED